METSKDKIKNEKYRNWVKGTLGIEQTSRAISEYVNEKFTLYLQGKATLNPQSYLTQAELSHVRDDIKALFRQRLKSLLKYKRNKASNREEWHWDTRTYNCAECIGTFQKILSLHRKQIKRLRANPKNPDYKDIHWENSNNTRNISLEWAIAKIFMPKGNENNSGPEDTDPSAMFKVMATCDLFTNAIRKSNLDDLIDARNSLFHSSDNLVSDDTVEDYFGLMKNLLVDASCDPDVDQSIRDRITEDIKKIETLKDSEMTMTLFEDALKIARKAIYYDFQELLCKNDPEQLKELLKLAVKLETELQFVNDKFDELQHQNTKIETLKNEVNDLKKERDGQQNEIKEMKDRLEEIDRKLNEQVAENDKLRNEVRDSKVEIRSMQEQLSDMQKQYDDKTAEIEDIIRQRDQHQRQMEQLRLNNDEQRDKLTLLQKELADQNNNVEALNGQVLAKTKELQTKDNEIEVLRNKIEGLQKENEEQCSEIERKRDENVDMHRKISNLYDMKNDQVRKIKELQEQISNKEGKITEQSREMKALQYERDGLYDKIQALKEKIDRNNVDLENHIRRARAHHNEIEEMRKQKDSTEWEAVVIISAFALGSFLLQDK